MTRAGISAIPSLLPGSYVSTVAVYSLQGGEDIERTFAALTTARVQGLIVLPGPVTFTHQATRLERRACEESLGRAERAEAAEWRVEVEWDIIQFPAEPIPATVRYRCRPDDEGSE